MLPATDSHLLRVLIVAPTGRDGTLITDLLRRSGQSPETCSSLVEACAAIRQGAGVAIIADEGLTPELVAELAGELRNQPPWSDLPVILLTRSGEVTAQSQRKRTLREPLGNVLLLERPVRPETLISTVENALRARRRQYEIRDQLRRYEQAQDALRKSEKLAVAGRLAASIAHEINNPLEAVTNLHFLMRDVADSAERAHYLQQAEQELARVTEITRQTLRFYREPAQPGPVSVVEVLRSILAFYHARIAAAGITVQLELDATACILASEGEMRQVFSNLITNAIDAMRGGGRLLIRARDAHGSADTTRPGVRVSVADTGTGIPTEIRKSIFEPFVSTKGDTGTGLGLWVTAEITQKLSGRIKVKSRTGERPGAPGTGTVFSIFWPGMDAADHPFVPPPLEAVGENSGRHSALTANS